MRSSLSRLLEFEGTFFAADTLFFLILFMILNFPELLERFIGYLFFELLGYSSGSWVIGFIKLNY
jgi:hypothetical protein